MTFIVPPGKNKILAAAWKGHKAAQRAEGKKKPEPVEDEVHKSAPKRASVSANVHKKAGKVHTAAKKGGKK